jgi:hypothetical protein
MMDPPFFFLSCLPVRFGCTKKLYDPWLPFCILGYLLSFIAVQRPSLSLSLSLSLFFLIFFFYFIFLYSFAMWRDKTKQKHCERGSCLLSSPDADSLYSSVRPSTFNEISNHEFRVCPTHCAIYYSPQTRLLGYVFLCVQQNIFWSAVFSSYIVPFYLFCHVNCMYIKTDNFLSSCWKKSLIFRVNC